MIDIPTASLALLAITLVAAVANGALGYGFSSITVPLALLFTASRVLNPALVIVEVGLNLYVLAVNWRSAGTALRRVMPVIVGLVPGVVVGSSFLVSITPDSAKLVTYTVLLPLILLQASGVRRPIGAERAVGVPLGAGVGLLYSVTTISGPPLALMLNNQGFTRRDFRASIAVIRVAESSLTAIAYLLLGLYTPASFALIPAIVPAVVVGVPLGAALIRRLDPETFRRVCMTFDAWIVGFGLARTVESLGILTGPSAYTILAAAALIDLVLLVRFFSKRIGLRREPPLAPATGGK